MSYSRKYFSKLYLSGHRHCFIDVNEKKKDDVTLFTRSQQLRCLVIQDFFGAVCDP
jgi:hypothetical protein